MGKHVITIHTNNAAFDEEPNLETARILHKLADAIERDEQRSPLLDINGNRVGTHSYEE